MGRSIQLFPHPVRYDLEFNKSVSSIESRNRGLQWHKRIQLGNNDTGVSTLLQDGYGLGFMMQEFEGFAIRGPTIRQTKSLC